MILALLIVFVVLLALAMPIAFVLIISGSTAALLSQGLINSQTLIHQILGQTQSNALLAIPFFILTGELLSAGGLGDRIVRFANELVGRFTGGLAHANVISALFFAGVSGSSVADASGIGSICIPWQKREKYPAPFSAAVNSSGATLGVIIPPSIPLILYAAVSNASIGALFLAGIVPGLVLALAFLITSWRIAKKKGYPKPSLEAFSWSSLVRVFIATLPAIIMPIFILVFIVAGITTVTEVSVIAVFYALIVSLVIYRDLTLAKLRQALVRSAITASVIMLIIMASSLVAYVLTVAEVPQHLTSWFLSVSDSPVLAITFMNLIMLVVGCFLDLPPAILLLGPVFVPLAQAVDINLIQLGVIMVLNLAIGLSTPPVGTVLTVSTKIADVKIEQAAKALLPFYGTALVVLALISYVPAFTIT